MGTTEIKPKNEKLLQSLEDLYIVCDRFSHAIRTQLGVSMGVIDDLSAGFELKIEDYQDAKRALETILASLNAVKEIANAPTFRPESCDIAELLSEFKGSRFELRIGSTNHEYVVDKKLFLRAVRCLVQYAESRCRRFPNRNGSLPVIVLEEKRHRGETREYLTISLEQTPSPDFPYLKAAKQFRDIATIDHSADSLGLLFADYVFSLHGAEATFVFDNSGKLAFQVVL